MDMEFFAVRCYPRYDDATNATVIQTSELSATFKGLKPSTDYAIQVRAKTTRGWGEYTPVVYKKTPHAMGLGREGAGLVASSKQSFSYVNASCSYLQITSERMTICK